MFKRVASSRIPLLLLIASLTFAAEPSLTHLFPAAGAKGAPVSVTAVGKFDPWPVQTWVDAPGIEFKPTDTAGKFDVTIADDAALGPHLVRFFNDSGASLPRFFIVSRDADLPDTEPNDAFKSPQQITTLPTTISGKLDKGGDVDSFAVALKKDQTLTASLDAYVLASTFDGLLRIVDEHGTQLAFNHDGRTLDPVLAWTAPRDGTFIVQLMGFVLPARAEVSLTGGEGCIYRLHLTTEPTPLIAFPPQVGEIEEQESENPQSITPPSVITGRIERANDEDRFSFPAAKGRAYALKLTAAQAGSPLDAWMRIDGADGKQLVRGDDSGSSPDPQLTWTAPGDGVFTVVLGEVTHRGGDDYRYRLEFAEAVPTVTGTSPEHEIRVTAGKTSELKITVKRTNGFKAKLRLAAMDLPEGTTAEEMDVPEKDGEIILKFASAPGAKSSSNPIRVVLREDTTEHAVKYVMASTAEDNGVPQGYTELVLDSTDQLWLTVIAETPKAVAPENEADKKS